MATWAGSTEIWVSRVPYPDPYRIDDWSLMAGITQVGVRYESGSPNLSVWSTVPFCRLVGLGYYLIGRPCAYYFFLGTPITETGSVAGVENSPSRMVYDIGGLWEVSAQRPEIQGVGFPASRAMTYQAREVPFRTSPTSVSIPEVSMKDPKLESVEVIDGDRPRRLIEYDWEEPKHGSK